MRLLRAVRAWLRALLLRSREEREMEEEIRFHVEMETAKHLDAGLDPREARRRALVAFGGVERFKEEVRRARGTRWLEDLARDVRLAARGLARRKGFAAAAILTLALGLGGNALLFGVVDALFLQPPPGIRAPERVVRLYVARDEGMIRTVDGGPGSWIDYEVMAAGTRGVSSVAGMLQPRPLDFGLGAQAERVRGRVVSWTYFPLLGVRPARGRFFTEMEDRGPAGAVAVLSHAFWRARFGGDPDIVGRSLLVNGRQLTVVGVAEAGFRGVELDPVDLWVPPAVTAPMGLLTDGWRTHPGNIAVSYLARVQPGAAWETVEESAAAALRGSAEAGDVSLDPTPRVIAGPLVTARGPKRTVAGSLALWLLGATGIVLVIACINVTNLLLARATARRRESAVRLSLGAPRGRLFRQHLTESVLLSLLGGVAALLLATAGSGLIRHFPLPAPAVTPGGRTLAFTLGLALLAGVALGVAPALEALRTGPGHLRRAGASATPGRAHGRRLLVGAQVALSLVLLVGAGLFGRSLLEAGSIDPGVDVERLLAVSVDLDRAGFAPAEREVFHETARRSVAALPGVESAAMANFVPLRGAGPTLPFQGYDTLNVGGGAYVNWVGADYFETTGTRVLRGRGFTTDDRAPGAPVAVANERMARLLAGDGSVVGACYALGPEQVFGGTGCTRIVGVVETERHRYLESTPVPRVFFPRDREAAGGPTWLGYTLLVRTAGDARDHVGEVLAAVRGIRNDLPYVTAEPLEERIRASVLPLRLGATLFTLFGVLALVLSAVGLHGVLGFFVAERAPELGVRRTLGAGRSTIVALVVRQGLAPVATGIAVGTAIALGAARLLEAMLFGIPAHDPATFVATPLFLVAVALVATWLPARRAADLPPMRTLRVD